MRLRHVLLLAVMACSTPDEGPNTERRIEVVQAPEKATPGFPLAEPVVLRVLDGDGAPLTGQEVTLAASDGGSVSPERVVSGVDGLVLANWRLGIHPGRQVLSASAVAAGRTDVEVTATVFRVTAINAGFQFGCGLADGEVWCWGVGSGPFYNPLRQGVAPERAMPGRQVVRFAASEEGVCAIDAAGLTWCRWGNDPAESQLAGVPPLSRISAGEVYFCGISAADRTPWCWLPPRYVQPPTQISPTLRLASITAGDFGPFGCGLDDAGDAWCWGEGQRGQLGDGTGTSSATPVRVAGGLRFREISSGGFQTCGAVDGGRIYCWGTATFGAGMPPSSLVPTPSGISGVSVSVGLQGGLAASAGTTTQWGGNIRLYFDPPQILQQLSGLERLALREVSADDSMCGMTADGVAYCSADVFVGRPEIDYTGPQWLPVPEPGADVPPQ